MTVNAVCLLFLSSSKNLHVELRETVFFSFINKQIWLAGFVNLHDVGVVMKWWWPGDTLRENPLAD